MVDTNESLLELLRRADAHDAWREFYRAYREPVLRYAHHVGARGALLEEVLQDTFVALVGILSQFRYDRERGRFRNFLLRIVHHRTQAALKRARVGATRHTALEHAESTDALPGVLPEDGATAEWEKARGAWRSALAAEALARVRRHPGTKSSTMEVFDDLVLRGEPAETVAARHGMEVGAVHQIRHRTLRRIQRELDQLLAAAGDPPA